MEQKKKQIKELVLEGLSIIKKMDRIKSDTPAGSNTRSLMGVANKLYPLIQDDYHVLSNIIARAGKRMIENGIINAFFFGDMRTSLQILKDKICDRPQKVFISHSSRDKEYIEEFVDHILQIGIGIDAKEIFCTSIEDMDIRNGEDMRSHIKDHILSSDFSFLMISENYKTSEICLNEMGAVWVNNNDIRYYTLPNTGFDKIGWLCDTKKAEQITDRTALDALHEELTCYYDLENRSDSWSRQRETFIKNVSSKRNNNVIANVKVDEVIMTNQNSTSEKIVALLKTKDCLSAYEIADALKLSRNTVCRCLSQLLAEKKVVKIGTARMTKWSVVSE